MKLSLSSSKKVTSIGKEPVFVNSITSESNVAPIARGPIANGEGLNSNPGGLPMLNVGKYLQLP